MMAARFRSVYWVALVSVTGLGCYLVTQRVAAERAALNKIDREIRDGRIAIRDLKTELGTRGSLTQIERWNADVLALKAPTAKQFIRGDVMLASLSAPAASLTAPIVQAVAAAPAPAQQSGTVQTGTVQTGTVQTGIVQAVVHAPAVAPRAAIIRTADAAPIRHHAASPIVRVSLPARVDRDDGEDQPMLRHANYMKPSQDVVRQATQKVAMLGRAPLDDKTLADLGRLARNESGASAKYRP